MDRRKNRYIKSEKGQARTYRARAVCDQALPNRSRETDETSGVDLTQKERRCVGLGLGVDIGN